jgi:hypothetical protein
MYDAMINNGWRRQNLLGEHHFNPDTHELTDAGKLKLQWILTQTPNHRRDIFVQRGNEQTVTVERIDSIHKYAAQMSPPQGVLNVNDTHLVPGGHPASMVDAVFTGYQKHKRPPVLPAASGDSGGSN